MELLTPGEGHRALFLGAQRDHPIGVGERYVIHPLGMLGGCVDGDVGQHGGGEWVEASTVAASGLSRVGRDPAL